jgi:hypothetical protein
MTLLQEIADFRYQAIAADAFLREALLPSLPAAAACTPARQPGLLWGSDDDDLLILINSNNRGGAVGTPNVRGFSAGHKHVTTQDAALLTSNARVCAV